MDVSSQITEQDIEALLGEVARFAQRGVAPTVERHEHVLSAAELATVSREAKESGILGDEAPDEVAFDDRFLRLVSDSDAAVDRLEAAVAARNQTALVNALRELRSFERLLWLNFG